MRRRYANKHAQFLGLCMFIISINRYFQFIANSTKSLTPTPVAPDE